MTFNEPRLAMFGGDLAPGWFALTFGLTLAGVRCLGWPDSGNACYHITWRIDCRSARLNLVGALQPIHDCIEAFGKALDIEIQRVIMAVRNIGVQAA